MAHPDELEVLRQQVEENSQAILNGLTEVLHARGLHDLALQNFELRVMPDNIPLNALHNDMSLVIQQTNPHLVMESFSVGFVDSQATDNVAFRLPRLCCEKLPEGYGGMLCRLCREDD